jgi:hypothetical protein
MSWSDFSKLGSNAYCIQRTGLYKGLESEFRLPMTAAD